MLKDKKILIILLSILVVLYIFVIIGIWLKTNNTMPSKYTPSVYSVTELENGNVEIEIDGVIYTEDFEFTGASWGYWFPANIDEKVSLGNNLYFYTIDEENIFLYWDIMRWEDFGDKIFAKKDFVFPEVSIEGIDSISFERYNSYKYSTSDYVFEHRDKSMIEKTFAVLEETKEVNNEFYNSSYTNDRRLYIGKLVFRNDSLKGIDVDLSIHAINDEYCLLLNTSASNYVEISPEFLSELTGINMPDAGKLTAMTDEEKTEFFMQFNDKN